MASPSSTTSKKSSYIHSISFLETISFTDLFLDTFLDVSIRSLYSTRSFLSLSRGDCRLLSVTRRCGGVAGRQTLGTVSRGVRSRDETIRRRVGVCLLEWIGRRCLSGAGTSCGVARCQGGGGGGVEVLGGAGLRARWGQRGVGYDEPSGTSSAHCNRRGGLVVELRKSERGEESEKCNFCYSLGISSNVRAAYFCCDCQHLPTFVKIGFMLLF